MNLDEYQKLAVRTMGQGKTWELDLAVLALGVAGEGGEVADYVKKVVGHGHVLETEKLVKEIGDALWYIAALSHHVGVPLSEVAEKNINKLKARYPDGFSSERSINRV